MKCLFCDDAFLNQNKIFDSENWIAIYDGYPVNLGHSLIIPKKHISSIFDITNPSDIIELHSVIAKLKKILCEKYHPDGFNIGINDGKSAGQTISHLHIHIIPRYINDGGLPCGVRNIFPKDIANYIGNKNE